MTAEDVTDHGSENEAFDSTDADDGAGAAGSDNSGDDRSVP